ncbi:MAG: hypothetical protein KBT21_08525, partial [Treponema sp.]|nr:hypothetical protein [Candidatus Treponema merdequi]
MAKYAENEIVRKGSDFSGGAGSIFKGRAHTVDGKKLWTSKDGYSYETEKEMKEADKVFEKEKSSNIFKTAAQNLQRQGEELRQKNDAEVEAIKKAKDEGKKVETDPTTGETLVNGKSLEIDKTPVQEVEKAEEKKAEKTSEIKEEPKTEEIKEPETPKEEEPKAEEKTPEQVAKEDTEAVQENEKAASDLLSRKEKFSNYLNSAHPSLFGAIFGDSGLSTGERIAMGVSALGKIIGSVLMANGMSLLGDNSYFQKIGEGVDLNSMTSDEQKKFADEMNNAMIETAKKAKRAEEVFDSNIKASKVNLTEEQRTFALTNINTYATMSDENAQKDLIAKGFTPEQAQVTVQALKRTV